MGQPCAAGRTQRALAADGLGEFPSFVSHMSPPGRPPSLWITRATGIVTLAPVHARGPAPVSFGSALAPFPFFDGFFFDRVELVEAHQVLDVVPRGDAFFAA